MIEKGISPLFHFLINSLHVVAHISHCLLESIFFVDCLQVVLVLAVYRISPLYARRGAHNLLLFD